MSQIRPFRAWRPRPELASQVASPPYDVMNSEEARAMAEGNPLSFLHVVKPEIDLDPGVDVHSDAVYAKGAENLRKLMDEGALQREGKPCFYVYQQRMGEHVQAGLVAGASVDEYESGLIKKHEFTRPDKEDDRTRHVNALDANTGPVFLTYAARPEIDALVDEIRARQPEYDFTSEDGIGHTLWVVSDDAEIARLAELFAAVPALYVADGHHRLRAAEVSGSQRGFATARRDVSESLLISALTSASRRRRGFRPERGSVLREVAALQSGSDQGRRPSVRRP